VNIFQLIKSVLDELYKRIPGKTAEKDKLINAQIKTLSKTYARLSEEAPKTNYADDITRFAYIYEYVTSHANVVYQLIRDSADLRSPL
jgi:ribosomal protein S20